MNAVVEGTLVPISELASLTDWTAVKKVGGSTIPRSALVHVGAVQQIKRRPLYQGNAE
jgi:hypothetical protein